MTSKSTSSCAATTNGRTNLMKGLKTHAVAIQQPVLQVGWCLIIEC